MGAKCTKGSKTVDPDKSPYGTTANDGELSAPTSGRTGKNVDGKGKEKGKVMEKKTKEEHREEPPEGLQSEKRHKEENVKLAECLPDTQAVVLKQSNKLSQIESAPKAEVTESRKSEKLADNSTPLSDSSHPRSSAAEKQTSNEGLHTEDKLEEISTSRLSTRDEENIRDQKAKERQTLPLVHDSYASPLSASIRSNDKQTLANENVNGSDDKSPPISPFKINDRRELGGKSPVESDLNHNVGIKLTSDPETSHVQQISSFHPPVPTADFMRVKSTSPVVAVPEQHRSFEAQTRTDSLRTPDIISSNIEPLSPPTVELISPARRAPVDMNVETNMAIFGALKGMKMSPRPSNSTPESPLKSLTISVASPSSITNNNTISSPVTTADIKLSEISESRLPRVTPLTSTSSAGTSVSIATSPTTLRQANDISVSPTSTTTVTAGETKLLINTDESGSTKSVQPQVNGNHDYSTEQKPIASASVSSTTASTTSAEVVKPSGIARPASIILSTSAVASLSESPAEVINNRSLKELPASQDNDHYGKVNSPTMLDRSDSSEVKCDAVLNGSHTSSVVDQTDVKRERVSKLPTSRLPSLTSPTSPTGTSSTARPTMTQKSSVGSPWSSTSTCSPAVNSQHHQQLLASHVKAISLDDEPVSAAKLKANMQAMLVDHSPENQEIVESHHLCPNTRTKLLQAVERWFTGNDKERENVSRVMTIHGKPGVGKTSFASEICRKFKSELVGSHFFHHKAVHPKHNLFSSAVQSFAYQLCDIFPGYVDAVISPDKIKETIDEGNAADLFDVLIARPLQKPNIRQDATKHMIIVLDGVDECDPSETNLVLQVINEFYQKAPEWLYMLVLLRDDDLLVNQLSHVQLIEVKGTSEAMTADLKRYFKDPMSPLIDRISLDGAITHLVEHSQGNFLCAYFLKERLERLPAGSKLALRDVLLFPSGLSDIYKESFQRLFDHLSKRYPGKESTTSYNVIVGLLIIALEPIDKTAFKYGNGNLDVDEALAQLGPLISKTNDGRVCLYHKNISDWLLSSESSAPPRLLPNVAEARQYMADLVMAWLMNVIGESKRDSVPKNMQDYALRHCLVHLTDVAKQQDNLAKILCSLAYVEEKLKLSQTTLRIVLDDYKHTHYQPGAPKGTKLINFLISLENYMLNSPELVKQIDAVYQFIQTKGSQLERHSQYTMNVAANYPTVPRIQQNARVDIGEQPWLEDRTAIANTPCAIKQFSGRICDVDTCRAEKYLVILTSEAGSNNMLHIVNGSTGQNAIEPIALSINDRTGSCVRILPDNGNIFIGSLTSFINMKTGKPVASGLDVNGMPLKERFSIECCDAEAEMLCFGATTLPWGGRSLHLAIFNLKSKKCVKVIELLKFKFGGSAQFGVKACALSTDASLVCACIKHTNKNELKATIWSTSNWDVLHAVDVCNDALTKCAFIGKQHVVFGSSSRTKTDGSKPMPLKSYIWSLQEKPEKVRALSEVEQGSVVCCRKSQFVLAQWLQFDNQATLNRWQKYDTDHSPDERHIIYGISQAVDIITMDKIVAFVSPGCIRLYQVDDMEKFDCNSSNEVFVAHNTLVECVHFFPRSDDAVVSYCQRSGGRDLLSAVTIETKSDGLVVGNRFFTQEKQLIRKKKQEVGRKEYFTGSGSSSDICHMSSDSSALILNNGCDVVVFETATGVRRTLPVPAGLADRNEITLFDVSSKETIVGVVYSAAPACVYVFDIKTQSGSKPVEIRIKDSQSAAGIEDFSFHPSNGNVLTYSKTPEALFIVWNQRSGAEISREANIDVTYIVSSPASDRLVVSQRCSDTASSGDRLVLRSSDNSFNNILKMAADATWFSDTNKSDVEFSGDGTVMIGICSSGFVYRAWNAGNGEVLMDFNLSGTNVNECRIDIAGWLTNTHVLLLALQLLVVIDISSGVVVTALPIDENLSSKWDGVGLRVSPRGNVIFGTTSKGALKVFQPHNLAAVKRKTTLQILKSK